MASSIAGLLRLIRYRFLLVAGLFPYFLGAAVAFHWQKNFNLFLFLAGFSGLFFVLVGVEAWNEFFDWHLGTDRVFQPEPKPVTKRTFFVGLASFFVALLVAIFLTFKVGLAIIVLSIIGFLAAFFYLGPPVKLTYRGLGELTIALSYGPLMMIGSYYLQRQRVDTLPIMVSIIPALLIFLIAITNEVPDYFQDRLVGKRNICVRLGQKRTVILQGVVLIIFYLCLLGGLCLGKFPKLAWLILVCLPFSFKSYLKAIKTCENPRLFIPTIRYMIIHYCLVMAILIAGYTFF
jgi:1,4-dihydroxy-2-naphthoate octaprenyltransferase